MRKIADGINGTLIATSRAHGLLHGMDVFEEGGSVVDLFYGRAQCLSRQVVLVKRNAKAQLGTALRGYLLFYHLRNHDHRHPKVQAFHHTVHTAVCHKNAGPLEHLKLWNVWSEQEILRDCTERGFIDAFAVGHDNLPGLIVKGAKAHLEEIRSVVKGGAKRNEEGWLTLEAVERKSWRILARENGWTHEDKTFIEGLPCWLKSTRHEHDVERFGMREEVAYIKRRNVVERAQIVDS
jgi:hypothetical protein